MLSALNEQIKSADRRLEEIVKADEVVRRPCGVPGVMFAVWRDGAEFDPLLLRPGEQTTT